MTTTPAPPLTRALLPVRAAATYLSVGKDKVYDLIRSGELPTVQMGSPTRSMQRIRVSDLDNLIQARTTQP